MVTRSWWLIVAIMFLLTIILSSCSDKESGILIGQFPGSKVQKVSPGNLKIKYFNYADSHVLTKLKFFQIATSSPKEGFMLVETRSDYGTLWVLADKGKFEKRIKKLKRGEIFQICGTVSASVINEDGKPQIAIMAQ